MRSSASFAGRIVRPACRSLGRGRSIVLWRARAWALRGCTPARARLEMNVCPCEGASHGRRCLIARKHLPLLAPQDRQKLGEPAQGQTFRLMASKNGGDQIRRQACQLEDPPDIRPIYPVALRQLPHRPHLPRIQHALPLEGLGQGDDDRPAWTNLGGGRTSGGRTISFRPPRRLNPIGTWTSRDGPGTGWFSGPRCVVRYVQGGCSPEGPSRRSRCALRPRGVLAMPHSLLLPPCQAASGRGGGLRGRRRLVWGRGDVGPGAARGRPGRRAPGRAGPCPRCCAGEANRGRPEDRPPLTRILRRASAGRAARRVSVRLYDRRRAQHLIEVTA